jgi:O-antigen ligase
MRSGAWSFTSGIKRLLASRAWMGNLGGVQQATMSAPAAPDPDLRISPRVLFVGWVALVWIGVAGAQAQWGAVHGVMFSVAGLLMVVFPPVAALPRGWWVIAAVFIAALGGAFLPDRWFPAVAWRATLSGHGLDLGTRVTAHPRAAMEMALAWTACLLGGMWIVGHRPSARGVRLAALAFAIGVACAAALALVFPAISEAPNREPSYGFFPNRNHNATLLAMGTIVALGCLVQAIREKRAATIAVASVVAIVCLWTLLGWSLSRAGVVLVGGGSLLWIGLMGRGALGSHGWRALLLLAAAAIGGFLIAEPAAKQRLDETIERVQTSDPGLAANALDFRIPTWLDTWAMIRERPLTGVGPGQFGYVFPQFRERTVSAQGSQQVHPESDWLWLAAEAGIPAAVALAALVAAAGIAGVRGLKGAQTRALRAACLVGAALVALHGLVDVPGHRVPLAWAAALLLGLGLRPPPVTSRAPRRIVGRAAGVVVLGIGVWLLAVQIFTPDGPAVTRADNAVATAMTLYRADQAALAAGDPAPAADADPLRKALVVLEDASATAPLDGRLHHLRGAIALHFTGAEPLADHQFAIERALDPTWIDAPLQQATAMAPVDPQRAAELCRIAIDQAEKFDRAGMPAPQGFPSWSKAIEGKVKWFHRRFPRVPRT